MDLDNKYILIQGFMAEDLKLNPTECMMYGLIYGFSQDGAGEFHGSYEYMKKWLNCGSTTVYRTLKSLEDKGLIKKEIIKTKTGSGCRYTANLDVLTSFQNEKTPLFKMKSTSFQNEKTPLFKLKTNNKYNNKLNNIYIPNTKNQFNKIETNNYDMDEYEKNVLDN